MSAHQMVCHLNDSFGAAFGDRRVSPATGIFQRTVMKWGALWLPLPWPHGVPTRPEIDQVAGGGTPPTEFAQDVAELERRTAKFVAGDFESGVHPIFGGMEVREWMRWAYLHMDHHLRQFGG